MRLFTAVELPEATRALVASFASELGTGLELGRRERLNTVPPENLHVTVHFLGSVPDAQVPEIVAALRTALVDVPSGTASVQGVGAFPKRKRPRVVWAGVDDPTATLARLHEAVTKALGPLGYPAEERRYHPHVTLARVPQKSRPPRQLVERIETSHESAPERDLGQIAVDHLTVFRSRFARAPDGEPGRGGPQYEPIARLPLGESVASDDTAGPHDRTT